MRAVLKSQSDLWVTPIEQIELNPKSRDDTPAVLRGLQFLLTKEALDEINQVVVANGRKELKHGAKDAFRCRADSAVARTNVEWPTDSRLLCDALRSLVNELYGHCKSIGMKGWRNARVPSPHSCRNPAHESPVAASQLRENPLALPPTPKCRSFALDGVVITFWLA